MTGRMAVGIAIVAVAARYRRCNEHTAETFIFQIARLPGLLDLHLCGQVSWDTEDTLIAMAMAMAMGANRIVKPLQI